MHFLSRPLHQLTQQSWSLNQFFGRQLTLFGAFRYSTSRMTGIDPIQNSLVAVAQMTATSDKVVNLATCTKLIEEASSHGAKVIFLPEAFDYIAESQVQSLELSEDLDGPLIKNYSELAVKHNMWLSLGGFHNKGRGMNKMFNSHLLISSSGVIAGQYNKTHLFDVEIPERKVKLKESEYIEKGSSITAPIQTPAGKIGLGICYDLRFPEFSLSLARMGAQILTYPSAFTVATGLAHWESLLRSRAIETQCYVIAAAQTGMHNAKRSSYGHAMVIDPWGAVIAQCHEGTGIALATINLTYQAKVRSDMPVSQHRRYDVYHLPEADYLSNNSLPDDEEVFDFGQVKIKGWSVFLRSRYSMAFVNRKCVVPGHVLIIPVRVTKRLLNLSSEEVADLFLTARRVQQGMEQFHDVCSSTLNVQDGPDAGQSIEHVHVHVLPRRPNDFKDNDDIYHELRKHDKGLVDWRSEDDMKQEAVKLRIFFKSL